MWKLSSRPIEWIQASDSGWTGKESMRAFQKLSAGKMGQPPMLGLIAVYGCVTAISDGEVTGWLVGGSFWEAGLGESTPQPSRNASNVIGASRFIFVLSFEWLTFEREIQCRKRKP
jgi:hypothetical protein